MTYTEITAELKKARAERRGMEFRLLLPNEDNLALSILNGFRGWKGFSDWFDGFTPDTQDAIFQEMRRTIECYPSCP
jgi:hypothetical protein